MNVARYMKQLALILAVAGICLPQPLMAAPASSGCTVQDVALGNGGVLLGQVVDTQGRPQSSVNVSLVESQKVLGEGKTDGNGYFAFSGLRGGVYAVSAADGRGVYRVWAEGTAPESAQQGALVVAGHDLARGQCGGLGAIMSSPWAIAGIVAVAVAVPVAVHAADDDDLPATP